jgi:hypothetical protein
VISTKSRFVFSLPRFLPSSSSPIFVSLCLCVSSLWRPHAPRERTPRSPRRPATRRPGLLAASPRLCDQPCNRRRRAHEPRVLPDGARRVDPISSLRLCVSATHPAIACAVRPTHAIFRTSETRPSDLFSVALWLCDPSGVRMRRAYEPRVLPNRARRVDPISLRLCDQPCNRMRRAHEPRDLPNARDASIRSCLCVSATNRQY